MGHHVLYTREQADQVLPLVRAIVEDQREVYLRVRAELQELRQRAELAAPSGANVPPPMRDDLSELRSYVVELEELGIRVADPELGIVVLRGIHLGQVVNLCWKLGEDRFRYWFPVDGAYGERRPLDAIAV
jgi:hypothetical protein